MFNQYKFGRTVLNWRDKSNINGNGYDFSKIIAIYQWVYVLLCMIIKVYISVYEYRTNSLYAIVTLYKDVIVIMVRLMIPRQPLT